MKQIFFTQRTIREKLLLSCGVTGSVIFNLTSFILGYATPGYNAWVQPISDLLSTKLGWLQSLNFVVFGVFMFFFAIGLSIELKKGFGAVLLPALQVLVAVGLVLTGLFTHEPAHTAFTILTFISLTIGFFVFAWRFKGDPRWKGWATYSVFCGILINIFLALFGYAHTHGGYAGLYERLAVFTRLVWSLLFTVRLLMGTRLAPP